MTYISWNNIYFNLLSFLHLNAGVNLKPVLVAHREIHSENGPTFKCCCNDFCGMEGEIIYIDEYFL